MIAGGDYPRAFMNLIVMPQRGNNLNKIGLIRLIAMPSVIRHPAALTPLIGGQQARSATSGLLTNRKEN